MFSIQSVSMEEEHEEQGDEVDTVEDEGEDEEWLPSEEHTACQSSKRHVQLLVDKKNILGETAEVATRIGLSHRQHVAITARLVKIGGVSLADTTLSTTSTTS